MIDDNEEICLLLQDLLSRRNIVTESAFSGEDGLERARQKAFDLILLDITLPDLNGIDLCRMLKADPLLKDIPVVLMSGNDTAQDRELGSDAGAVGFLGKPFKVAEMTMQVLWAIQLKPKTPG